MATQIFPKREFLKEVKTEVQVPNEHFRLTQELFMVKQQLFEADKQLNQARQQISGLLKRQHEDAKLISMLRGEADEVGKLKGELETVKKQAEEIRLAGESKVEYLRNFIVEMNQEVTGVIRQINSQPEVSERMEHEEQVIALDFNDSDLDISEDGDEGEREELEFLIALQAYQKKVELLKDTEQFPVLSENLVQFAVSAVTKEKVLEQKAEGKPEVQQEPKAKQKLVSDFATPVAPAPKSTGRKTPGSQLRVKLRKSLRNMLNWSIVENTVSDDDDEEYSPEPFHMTMRKRKQIQPEVTVFQKSHSVKTGTRCECGYQGPNTSALRKHVDYYNLGRRFQCEKCSQKLSSCYKLKMHYRKVHNLEKLGLIGCRQCGKTFTNRKVWAKHRESVHGAEQ